MHPITSSVLSAVTPITLFLFAHPALAQSTASEVQTLQAWYGAGIVLGSGYSNNVMPNLTLSLNDCKVVKENVLDNGRVSSGTRDCSEPLREVTRMNGDAAPMLSPFVVDAYSYIGHPESTQTSLFGCATVEIRTVSAVDVVADSAFEGIGFYFEGTTTFVPKSELEVVGHTELRDGRAALVHRFLGTDLCKRSGASHYGPDRTEMKAFARVAGQDRWESIPGNHEIGYANQNHEGNSGWGGYFHLIPDHFDRQDEILKK